MIRRLVATCCVLALSLVADRAEAGIIHTAAYSGHTYHLLDGDGIKWWDDFEAEAVSLGGHLVTINDAAEDAFVFSTFGPLAVAYRAANFPNANPFVSLFIGYSDTAVEGTWVWASGSNSAYTNWIPGEPIVGDTNQQYAGIAINGFVPSGWHDIFFFPGSDFPLGVVEVENVGSVPEPATLSLCGIASLGLGANTLRRRRRIAARP